MADPDAALQVRDAAAGDAVAFAEADAGAAERPDDLGSHKIAGLAEVINAVEPDLLALQEARQWDSQAGG